MKSIEGLPDLTDRDLRPTLRVSDRSAFIRAREFIARIGLQSGEVEWLVERPSLGLSEAAWRLPRRICFGGSELWVREADQVVADITTAECGGLVITAWHAATGSQLWEQFIPIPDGAADWAETSPPWPGAQTEEIDAFISTRRTNWYCASRVRLDGILIIVQKSPFPAFPPYGCQTDSIRFDPVNGQSIGVRRLSACRSESFNEGTLPESGLMATESEKSILTSAVTQLFTRRNVSLVGR